MALFFIWLFADSKTLPGTLCSELQMMHQRREKKQDGNNTTSKGERESKWQCQHETGQSLSVNRYERSPLWNGSTRFALLFTPFSKALTSSSKGPDLQCTWGFCSRFQWCPLRLRSLQLEVLAGCSLGTWQCSSFFPWRLLTLTGVAAAPSDEHAGWDGSTHRFHWMWTSLSESWESWRMSVLPTPGPSPMLTRPLSTISLWRSFEATIRTWIACIRLVHEPRILQKKIKGEGQRTETNNEEDCFLLYS